MAVKSCQLGDNAEYFAKLELKIQFVKNAPYHT